jgi:hypothetical protein
MRHIIATVGLRLHLVVVLGVRIHRRTPFTHRGRHCRVNAPRLVCMRHTISVVRREAMSVRHRILWATALTICVAGPRSVALTCRAPRYVYESWLRSPARHRSYRTPVDDWFVRPVTWTTREHMNCWLGLKSCLLWHIARSGLALHLTRTMRGWREDFKN